MRVLFAMGGGYLPQRTGGAQSSTDQLASQLRARGHEVGVLCRLFSGGWVELSSRVKRRLTGRTFARGAHNGYPVWRAWDPTTTAEIVERFKPDVAIVQNGSTVQLASNLARQGVPVVLYFRNVEFDELAGDPSELQGVTCIANSEFTARTYRSRFGVECHVIPPFVDGEQYRTTSSRENVTFINPTELKGAELALAIAERCPDIPFTFVESWTLHDDFHAGMLRRLSGMPHVTLRPRTTDMRAVYGRARILLVPSRWEEAWGRVATEAHFSGIPVVASRRGGLPEAVGPGGVVLDHDAPVEEWVAEVRRLWDDPAHHERLSAAALAWSERPEMRPDHQIGLLIDVLRDACAAAPLTVPPTRGVSSAGAS